MPQTSPICQSRLPFAPWMDAMVNRLPGLQPVAHGDWLIRDDAFAAQMAVRDDLIANRRTDVVATTPGAADADRECLEIILAELARDPGYVRSGETVIRPDGVAAPLTGDAPLAIAARLIQEDIAVLHESPQGHVLRSAAICFPASWTLAQKIGRPMIDIHIPVARYDAGIAARVERIFTLLRPEAPVWRANYLRYNTPALYHPLREGEHRPFDPALPAWVRVERQTLLRLPATRAIVFTIHTFVVPAETLTAEETAALAIALPLQPPE
jgi:hypothetical protein